MTSRFTTLIRTTAAAAHVRPAVRTVSLLAQTNQSWVIKYRHYSSSSAATDKPSVTVSKDDNEPTVAIVTLHQSAFIFDVIYSSRLNTAASMHGHSLGLGCVLGMACQDRFMMGGAPGPKQPTIGLNEVAVGVPVPHWLAELFAGITSRRHAERLLPLGRILSVQEALSVGLVDKTDFKSQEEMDAFVIRYLANRSKAPQDAQTETMRVIRRNFLQAFRASEEEDVANITHYVANEEAQTILKASLAKLSNKSKA
ncbi:dodecenoyl-CoA isomerase [Podila humilis]|nr:dodecenoyl-CoA isomerase [Podila humilis]